MSVIKPVFEPTKLVWLDLEMTGLDPESDLILEVAVEITDMNLQTLASYETRVRQNRNKVLDRMNKNTWWQDFPENRDDFVRGLAAAKPIEAVEKELVDLIEHHFGSEPAVLAGNSIHNDRNFIRSQLPGLELKLHYRMVDVSSFKIMIQSRYKVYFEKPEVHRAYEDVQASIAELQHYIDLFEKR